ncbi:MAG: YCF48-related protein [Candidatus Kapaibacterium sp.]
MKKLILLLLSVIAITGTLSAADSLVVSTMKTGVTGGDMQTIEFINASTGFIIADDASYPANNTVLKTTDGGLNWVSLNVSALTERPRSMDFVSTTVGYIAGYAGMVIKTTDGGLTWTALTTGVTNNLNDVKFWDANLGYLAGTSGLVMKTTDGGTTWVTQSTTGTNARYAIEFLSQNEVMVVSSSSTITKTTDAGTSWTVQTITPSATLYDIKKVSSTTIWICGSSQVIFKSTDAGVSFSIALDNGTAALYSMDFADSLRGMFVGSNGINYRTTNGGVSFDSSAINTFTAQVCRAVFMKSQTEIIVGADMGNILRSTNGGNAWNLITTASYLYGMNFLNTTTGMCVGYRGIALKTTNSAVTWTDSKSINGFEAYDVKMVTANNVFACATSGRFYASTDGGMTFVERNLPALTSTIKTISFLNSNEGFAGNEAGGLYKTTDAGLVWTQVFSFGASNNNIEDIYFVNDSVGFACGEVGKFVKTTNRGATWDSTGIDGPGTKTLWEMSFLNVNTGYIGSTNGCIYKTSNGGANWTLQNDTTGLFGVDVIDIEAVSETRGIATGEQGKLFKIIDANQWVVDKTILTNWGLTENLWNVNFVSTNVAYLSGYYGTIYKVDVLTGTGTGNEQVVSDYSLNQNYPNPFNPVTTIDFSIPKQEFVTMTVYDLLGKEIKNLVSSNLQAGKYTVNFAATNLPSGIYFYKLTAGSYSSVKKMTLIK